MATTVHAWKVIVRDKAGNVIPLPDGSGRELKVLIAGRSERNADGTISRWPCQFQTEAEVCDHVRKHYHAYVPIGAYDADRDPPAMLMPVPPSAYQFGIMEKVIAELGGVEPVAAGVARREVERRAIVRNAVAGGRPLVRQFVPRPVRKV